MSDSEDSEDAGRVAPNFNSSSVGSGCDTWLEHGVKQQFCPLGELGFAQSRGGLSYFPTWHNIPALQGAIPDGDTIA
jgi:hypothetical protein